MFKIQEARLTGAERCAHLHHQRESTQYRLAKAASDKMARHIVEYAKGLRAHWLRGSGLRPHLLERAAALGELIGGIEAALERDDETDPLGE